MLQIYRAENGYTVKQNNLRYRPDDVNFCTTHVAESIDRLCDVITDILSDLEQAEKEEEST